MDCIVLTRSCIHDLDTGAGVGGLLNRIAVGWKLLPTQNDELQFGVCNIGGWQYLIVRQSRDTLPDPPLLSFQFGKFNRA